jgi:hypothetical protein
MAEVVFVVLRHVKDSKTNSLWRRCVASIQQFHPGAQIVIIDDNSPIQTDSAGCTLIQSDYPGAGELLPYYYFWKHQWAGRMVFLHDSMFLRHAFTDTELFGHELQYLWHFEKHKLDDIEMARAMFNLCKPLHNNEQVLRKFSTIDTWYGCFGVASIISLDAVKQIEDTYGFFSKSIEHVSTRIGRMACERIFGIIAFQEGLVTTEDCSVCGSIFKHPHQFEENLESEVLEEDIASMTCAVVKTWHGR